MTRLLSLLGLILVMVPTSAASQVQCEFKLGFKALRDQIPDIVGTCLENEWHNTRNGNTEQRTTAHHGQGGLLVWRKADNWTAFTDGHWTWINGPFGVQKRLNSGPLFAWEAPAPAQDNAAPRVEVPSPPAPAASEEPGTGQWARHDDPEKSFEYPAGWIPHTDGPFNFYISPDGQARIIYLAPFRMGREAKATDFLGRVITSIAANESFELGTHRATVINGFPADFQVYAIKGRIPLIAIIVAIQRGSYVHLIDVASTAATWDEYESQLIHVVESYVPKTD